MHIWYCFTMYRIVTYSVVSYCMSFHFIVLLFAFADNTPGQSTQLREVLPSGKRKNERKEGIIERK